MKSIRAHVLWSVLILGIFLLTYTSDQANFPLTIGTFSLSFVAYLFIYFFRSDLSLKHWEYLAIAAFLIPLFSTPTLSPDFYRFLWDGELTTLGIHPYAYTPDQIMELNLVKNNEYMQMLYSNITELSRRHYSPYPTINQLYFIIPAWFTESILPALIIMRLLIFSTMFIGYRFVKKLLVLTDKSERSSLLLLFNPFLIIEVMDNLHFEGVMMAWLVIGIYYLFKQKWITASLFWGVAVAVKLTPLILLPALLRFFKPKKTIFIYSLVSLFSVGITMIMLWPSYASNVFRSIRLYFNNFEFNASILHFFEWIIAPFTEYGPIVFAGPITVSLGMIFILIIALRNRIHSPQQLLSRFMWIYVVYLLFATTVHPWYIILPLILSLFSKNKGVLVWSFLIMLSYGFYHWEMKWVSNLLVTVEYIILALCLLFGSQIDGYMKRISKKISA